MNVVRTMFICAAAIVAAIAGCGSSTQPVAADGRSIAETFLKQITDGQPGTAWDSTTAEFKSARGRERFIDEISKLTWWKSPLIFESEATVAIGDQSRTELSFKSASGEIVKVLIGSEQDVWKVDRLSW